MGARRLFVFLAVTCAVSTATAQLPGPKLKSIFPPSGQVGTSLEVSIDGSDLNAAERLVFSHPGITGVPVMTDGDEFIKRRQWQRHRFTVTIGADVPPGVYEGRFVGRYGVSNASAFVVGDLPQGAETTGNDSHEKAHEIALNSVVVGRVDAGKADCFRISLKAGQNVLFDCQAGRIGSRLDAVLEVFDASGSSLARSQGKRGIDPVLAFKAPADASYLVRVSDFLSAGGGDYLFRLVVSDRPYISSIFPPAGVPGTKSKHTLYGANFPGGAEKLEVEIEFPHEPMGISGLFPIRPRELVSAGINYQFQNSSTVRIPFATAPVVIEDPNLTMIKVTLPCEVAGQFSSGADSDRFDFDAKKGETFILEAISHRAGYATDLFLAISAVAVDDKGKRTERRIAQADDESVNPGGRRAVTSSRDPSLTFTVPEDGTYSVQLYDQFELDDRRASYRLSIRRPAPDFALLAEIENPRIDGKRLENWSPSLLRGGRLHVAVRALRRDGFDGEIELGVEGGQAGIEVIAGKIGKGKISGLIVLAGEPGLAKGIGELRIVGTAGDLVRRAYATSLVREVGDYDNEEVVPQLQEGLVLASNDSATPMGVGIDVPSVIETVIGGTVEIPLRFAKQGTFKGNTKFFLGGVPNIKKRTEINLDLNKVAEGKLSVPIKPTNENKYTAGEYVVYVSGEGVLQFHSDPQSVVEAIEDQKAIEPLVAAAAESLKQVQGSKGEIAKQAGLTEEERAKQLAAADEAIAKAQQRSQAVDAAKKRAAENLTQANERNKPRDLPIMGYSRPVKLKIAAAPLRFKEVPELIELGEGVTVNLAVTFERLFGFANAVELSCVPPKDVPGFDLQPASVPKDQVAGILSVKVNSEAPEGVHAFTLVGKMKFNGVDCVLRQAVKFKVLKLPDAPPPTP